jgi:transcription elongation GreA/GreB family factor
MPGLGSTMERDARPAHIDRRRRRSVSVAFRRESDEEHKEPRFELPIPAGPNLVTARGLAAIEARVAAMEADDATAGQDEAAQEDHRRTLRYWRTRLATAQLTDAPTDGEVGFGMKVRFSLNGETREIEIVGDDEADPNAGRLAFSAPLARAMMGAEPGETVDFNGKADAIRVLAAEAL